MHSSVTAKDPGALSELVTALQEFIKEGGAFYSLPSNEIKDLQVELTEDVKSGFSPGKKRLLYACACVVREGWKTMEMFLQYNFTTESLMFSMGPVERSAVFHALEVMLRSRKIDEAFHYSKIFENPEKFIIVSGVAGAGKSTLLENIALQFIKPRPDTSTHLKDFQLLIYVQCRDFTTKNLSEVIRQQLGDVCTKLGEAIVIEALFELRTLFLIDGFDEYGQSMTVVQEVIKKAWRANCRVIITTRPHGARKLEQLLSGNRAIFEEFEIASLTKLDEQLNFLAKYEPHLTGNPTARSLQKSFQSLDQSLMSMFSEPLKLLQFCNVFVTFPDRIEQWKRPSDLAKDAYQTYKALAEKKLADTPYPNLNIVIDDLFLIICEAALEFLRSNTLTFTEAQFLRVQRQCHLKLSHDHKIKDLDCERILSSVLKTKRPLTRQERTVYSFNHKTDEEYFASQWVVEMLLKANKPLKEILLGEELFSQLE